MLGSTPLGLGLTGLGLPLPPQLPEEALEGIATPTINGLPIRGIPAFQPGNVLDLGCNFTDTMGNPQNPSVVILRIRDPLGLLTTATYPGTILLGAQGSFGYDLTPPTLSVANPSGQPIGTPNLYNAGQWIIEWSASGTLVADTGPIEFSILPSVYYP